MRGRRDHCFSVVALWHSRADTIWKTIVWTVS